MTDSLTPDAIAAKTRGDGALTPATDADHQQARDFAIESARMAHDDHCTDVIIFDVRGLSPVTDFVIIASGTSDRQIKAVGSHIAELGRESFGLKRYGSESDGDRKWLVLDFVTVMVHLFEPITRAHYDLEMLWADAPKVEWKRPT